MKVLILVVIRADHDWLGKPVSLTEIHILRHYLSICESVDKFRLTFSTVLCGNVRLVEVAPVHRSLAVWTSIAAIELCRCSTP